MSSKYVWIISRATSHEDGTETAEVIHQVKTQQEAQAFLDHGTNGPNLGYEGPVQATKYPVGMVFTINDGSPV